MTIDARLASDITGSEVYRRAFILAGASKGAATLALAPLNDLGAVPRLYVAAGNTTLTLAHTRGGTLTSTSAGSTSMLIPPMIDLGYTRDSTNPLEIAFLFQRCGTGPLFVNGFTATNRGSVSSQAAMIALSNAVKWDYCVRTDLGNAKYILTGSSYSVAGNWQTEAAAGRTAGTPSVIIHWNDLDPQYLPQFSPEVMLKSCGLDEYVAS